MKMRKLIGGSFDKLLCVVLAVAMATGPTAAATAQNPVPQRGRTDKTLVAAADAGQAAPPKADLSYVTPQAVALVTGQPHHLLTAPGSELLPLEVVTAIGHEHLGFQPEDVTQFVAFLEPPDAMGPRYGLMLKLVRPVDLTDLKTPLRQHTRPGDLDGQPYLQSADPRAPSLYMPDDKTLLAASDATLRRMLEVQNHPQTSPLLKRAGELQRGYDVYALADVASVRPIVNPLITMALRQPRNKIPPALQQSLADASNQISAVELKATLTGVGPSSLVVHADDEAAAKKLAAVVGQGLDLVAAQMKAEMARTPQSGDPVERAAQQYSQRLMNLYLDLFRPMREGKDLVFFRVEVTGNPMQQQLTSVAVIGILVALLLPAVQAAREAARRNQSMNQMKQFMLALLNYESRRRTFPAHAIYSKDGKPLLSWRVAILPYIEEQRLYNEFHLDEPWDSPHNKTLIARMPKVFENPSLNVPAGKTVYLGVVGKNCIFDGSKNGIGLRQVTDGTSKTIMLVEADADQAVEWTKPADWEFNPKKPIAGLGSAHPGGFLVAFADGSIQFISNAVDPDVLKALLTRNGGEVVDRP